MALDEQRLVVALEARMAQYERDMARAASRTKATFQKMEDHAKRAGSRMEQSLRTSTANINQLIAGIGSAAVINQLRQLAEVWSDVSSRVNIAAGSQEKGAAVMDRLSQIARRTYSDLGQTAEAYIANSTALKELGYSTQTQLDYTEALNNALVVSGAKGDRARSVMDALGKAMALGKLSGDNLNTVLATGGRVAQALADGLGVGVNQLRQLGAEGKITGDKIVKALTGELAKLREEADSMPATISDAMVLLKNSLTEYVGKLNDANGITSIFANGIMLVADNVDSIAKAAAAAGAVILSGYVPAITRATIATATMVATNPFLLLASAIGAATFAIAEFGDEIKPIEGDLANLQDYAAVTWDAIKSGVLGATSTIGTAFVDAVNLISSALGGAEISLADLADFAKQAANNVINAFALLYDTLVTTFTKLPAAIADAVITGMNALIAGVENALNKVVAAVNSVFESINSVGENVGVSLGTISSVTLGRIENTFAGAGKAAGEAYGEALKNATRDRIGEALGSLRSAANAHAAERIAGGGNGGASIDSTDTPVSPVGAGSSGGRSGRSGGSGGNAFERQVAQIQQRIAALRAETEARRGLTGSLEEQESALKQARMKQELLAAAEQAGLQLTPELRARIDELAQNYASASQEAKGLADSQEQAARTAQEMAQFAGGLVSGFVNDLRQGKSASEAFANALNKIVDKLIDMAIQMLVVKPLLSLFGFSGGGLVGGAPQAGATGSFDRGGYTGNGGKYEPAGVVHRGEYVLTKEATNRIGVPALDALNYGLLPAFDTGGYVGNAPAVLRAPELKAGNSNHAEAVQEIVVNTSITVNGSAGTPEQNNDLAQKMAKQMEQSMRGVIADEIRRQTRPGNFMNTRSR